MTDNALPINTISSGSSLSNAEPIRIQIQDFSEEPDLLEMNLRSEGSTQTFSISESDQRLDQIIELQGIELDTDMYTMSIELFNGERSLGTHDTWFYYTEEEISVSYVTVKPHSVSVGEPVEITATLLLPENYSQHAHAQIRINGKFDQESTAIDNKLYFEIEELMRAGLYNITLDIYPWHSERINQNTESTYQYTMELLVVPSKAEDDREEHIVQASQELSIEDNLLYYAEDRMSTIISIDAIPDSSVEERFFMLSDDRVMLALQNVDQELRMSLITAEGRAERSIALKNQELSLSVYETDVHFTVLLASKDRVVWGDIIPYTDFSTGEENTIATGLALSNMPPGIITISSIQEQESLFKQYASLEFGNFLLYADGFEFQQETLEGSNHSENISQEPSFLSIPPGEWIEFPPFAIDEQSLVIETQFHPEDSLSGLELVLLGSSPAEDSEDSAEEPARSENSEEVFLYSGTGTIRAKEEILAQNILIDHNINLSLNYVDKQVVLTVQSLELPLTEMLHGNYTVRIQNSAEATEPIRLDSIALSNTAEEFVDQVLDTLP